MTDTTICGIDLGSKEGLIVQFTHKCLFSFQWFLLNLCLQDGRNNAQKKNF